MKNKALILLIILLLGFTFFIVRHQYAPRKTAIGVEAPEIELTDIQKTRLKLSELKGSVVFINFWATWCPTCVEEMPFIEGLFRNLSGTTKFRLITIFYRDNWDRVSRYMKERGYTFPVYSDPDGYAAKRFGITGVPEAFIIDKKGVLRDKVVGPLAWDSPQVIEAFYKLINE